MTSDKNSFSPIVFEPIYKEKMWGGQALATTLGKKIPAEKLIGESWEISGFPGDFTTVRSTPFGGMTLKDLMELNAPALLGQQVAAAHTKFPLLYKYIDANDKLSVQVHPDDPQARANNWGSFGKTECWYIVDAKPGAKIICGLQKGVTVDALRTSLTAGTIESSLNYIDIRKGDMLFVPAGTVHAIMNGTLIYEVQQSSDTTFRFYDWNRLEPNGKPRQLHIEQSLAVTDTTYHTRHKIPPVVVSGKNPDVRQVMRVACRYFALEEYICKKETSFELPRRQSFSGISVLSGSFDIDATGAPKTTVTAGDSLLVPASLSNVRISAHGAAHCLVSWVPDLKTEVVTYLRNHGSGDKEIELLGGNPAKNDLRAFL